MAYDPDFQRYKSCDEASQVFAVKDRQEPYDKIYKALVDKGFGVTRVGDVMTVRKSGWDATFILHEIKLDRDFEAEREG